VVTGEVESDALSSYNLSVIRPQATPGSHKQTGLTDVSLLLCAQGWLISVSRKKISSLPRSDSELTQRKELIWLAEDGWRWSWAGLEERIQEI